MYRLNTEQQRIVETAGKVADQDVAPHAERADRDGAFPSEAMASLGAHGFLGLTVPVEFGGMGQGLRTAAAVVDELARRCSSSAMVYVMHLCGIACYLAARDKTAPFLEQAAKGTHLSTLAFSEAGSRATSGRPSAGPSPGTASCS